MFTYLNHPAQVGVSSCCSVTPICLCLCSPGLRPESAPAAGHDRAWCHQACGDPPSRRETPPPWATVPHEISSTPPWRYWRLHQWGKNTSQLQHQSIWSYWKLRLFCHMVKSKPKKRVEMKGSVLSQSLNFIFKSNDFLIINLYQNKQFGSYNSVSYSCAPARVKKCSKLNKLLELFSSFPSRKLKLFSSHIYPLRHV